VTATLHFEWIKFWSLRSPLVLLVAMISVTGGAGALFAFARARQWDGGIFDPLQVSLSAIPLTQVVAGTLGLLAVTTETASGTLRPTFTAVPRRGRVLAAKAVLVGLTTLAAGTASAFTAFHTARPVLVAQSVPSAGLGDPGTVRAILGAGLYLTATALIGLALGVLTRSSAGALAILTGTLLIVPIFLSALPEDLAGWMMRLWPSTAGLRVVSTVPDPLLLGPWQGLAVLAATAAVLLAAAAVTFSRRDT